MKNTSQITDLHTDSRIFSVQGDDYRADVVKGSSIRIHGIDANNVRGPQSFDRTYQLGDDAVYDSYNMVYTGEIVSITDKTVTIDTRSTGGRTKRLPLAVFVARNHGWDLVKVAKHNAVESQCI
tara:strand:- start:1045 stop:1416 length:372 start_codon:yes stop_codon:yes gene_type:complete